MAEAHEFNTGGLEAVAAYLRQRGRSVKKPQKRLLLYNLATEVELAANRIVKLERRLKRKKK